MDAELGLNFGWRYLAAGIEELSGLARSDVMRVLPSLFTLLAVLSLSLLAFQALWNHNHPEAAIALTGEPVGPTTAALSAAPIAGFASGQVPVPAACAAHAGATPSHPADRRLQ